MAAPSRQNSFSSSVSTLRPPSASSVRNTSHGPMSNSVGSGYRTAPPQSYRPHSAMAGSRINKTSHSMGRPLNAMEVHPDAPGTGRVVGNQKGMPRFSLSPKGNPRGHKEMVRYGRNESYKGYASGWARNSSISRSLRDVSLCTAMNGLRLDEPNLQPTPAVGQEAPVTPSQIPKWVQNTASQGVLPQTPLPQSMASSPCKASRKTAKPPPKFLTRDSNVELAWDTDSRLDQFESNFTELKGQMSRITDEGNSMKDMIAMYRTKSRSAYFTSSIFADMRNRRGAGRNKEAVAIK